MKYTKSIRFKIAKLNVIPLLCVSIIFIIISNFIANVLVNDNTDAIIESVEKTTKGFNNEWIETTLGFASAVARNPTDEILQAFNSKDSATLAELSKDAFAATHCDGMTYADMDGNAVCRVTNPAKFGDNIKSSAAIADALLGNSVSYAYPTSNNGFSIAAGVPFLDKQNKQIGVIFLSKRLDKDEFINKLKEMTECEIDLYQNNVLVKSSTAVISADNPINMDDKIWQTVSSGESIDQSTKINGKEAMIRYIPITGRNNQVVGAIKATFQLVNTSWVAIVWIVTYAIALIILIPIVSKSITNIVKPIHNLSQYAAQLSLGDVNVSVVKDRDDELGVLQKSFVDLVETMKNQASALNELSQGNLNITYSERSELDTVGKSLAAMIDSNRQIITQIALATSQVTDAAGHVSNDSQVLASGASEQSDAIKKISLGMNTVGEKSKENENLALDATKVSSHSNKLMELNISSMTELVNAMNDISDASASISKVIKVIDDIAFQTNILALNAAVEAARAGTAGKGFAVVAEEVRNLAAKSADAARETTSIIEGNIAKVKHGNSIVEKSNASLSELAENSAKINNIVTIIADGSSTQSQLLDEIKDSVEMIADVINSNSAAAESSAAASQQLSGQSEVLNQLVSQYKL